MDNYTLLVLAEKMSESDKKLLVALLIIVFLIIMIFGYLQKLVGWIMNNQGHQVDTMMYDIMRTRVIDQNQKKIFNKEAYRKSEILFLKKSWPSFLAMAVFVGVLIIYAASVHQMDLSFFPKAWQDLTPTFTWPTSKFFGLMIPSDWPTLDKAPDFSYSNDKYLSLLVIVGFSISAVFFLVYCQALCARSMRIRQLGRTYFRKDINKIDHDHI